MPTLRQSLHVRGCEHRDCAYHMHVSWLVVVVLRLLMSMDGAPASSLLLWLLLLLLPLLSTLAAAAMLVLLSGRCNTHTHTHTRLRMKPIGSTHCVCGVHRFFTDVCRLRVMMQSVSNSSIATLASFLVRCIFDKSPSEVSRQFAEP